MAISTDEKRNNKTRLTQFPYQTMLMSLASSSLRRLCTLQFSAVYLFLSVVHPPFIFFSYRNNFYCFHPFKNCLAQNYFYFHFYSSLYNNTWQELYQPTTVVILLMTCISFSHKIFWKQKWTNKCTMSKKKTTQNHLLELKFIHKLNSTYPIKYLQSATQLNCTVFFTFMKQKQTKEKLKALLSENFCNRLHTHCRSSNSTYYLLRQ